MSTNSPTDTAARKDFISSCALAIFALWMIWQSSQYPIEGDYGGVTNAWYVSPALMPLFIGFCLLVLSGFQMVKSGSKLGWSTVVQKTFWSVQTLNESKRAKLQIIVLFVLYVVGLIPNTDFMIASWLFLLCLTARFYLPDAAALNRQLMIMISVASLIAFIIGLTLNLDSQHQQILLADTAVLSLLGFAWAQTWIYLQANGLRTQRKQLIIGIILLPLLIVLAFKYFLLVPMPTEGAFLRLMDHLYYGYLR